ncbi:MAG: hypothetical protein AAGU19_08040 [Prolixibacteraceae bacterium]
MKTKFTTGEWTHDDLNTGLVPYVRCGNKIIASLCLTDGITPSVKLKEEESANAKLIIAAPKLLNALIQMVEQFNDLDEYGDESDKRALDKARKAIRKAIN